MGALRYGCVSDTGRTHEENQDRWLADPEHGLFLVTDGMANAIAPQAVIDQLPEMLHEVLIHEDPVNNAGIHQLLRGQLADLSQRVHALMVRYGEQGLGATLVLTLVREHGALIAHLGDSRVYLFRGGKLTPLTRDHSLMNELVDRGVISEEDALTSRDSGGPTRFLGMANRAEAELQMVDLQTGDSLLLCSDGLTGMLTNLQIQVILQRQLPPQDTCQSLVDAANEAGGTDNITVLVVEVGS